jgi:hypothetical protein
MPEAVMVRQALLTSGSSEMVAWLNPGNKRFKVGSVITLKNHADPTRRWTVRNLYGAQPLDQLHTDWRVGGL